MKVVILRGIPASGKSTYARQFLKDNPTFIRTNMDELRLMFGTNGQSQENRDFKNERLVKRTEVKIIQDALEHNTDVLIDDTNITLKRVKYLIQKVMSYTPTIEVRTIPVDVMTRNKKRKARVPFSCMTQMKNNYAENERLIDNYLESVNIQHTKI